MARPVHSLSPLRSPGYPGATQDSLPAAGQALPGGVGYPQGSCERFLRYNASSFPKLSWRTNEPILVTGAAGQLGGVGRSVSLLLLEQGLPVRALVRRDDER